MHTRSIDLQGLIIGVKRNAEHYEITFTTSLISIR